MNPEETAYTFKYAFITTDVWEGLQMLRTGRTELPAKLRRALGEGAKLLLEMRRGTSFVLDVESTLGFSEESLPAASRALCTLEALDMVRTQGEVPEILKSMNEHLEYLASREASEKMVADEDLAVLEKFFAFLSESFTSDVVESSFGAEMNDESELFPLS